MTLVCGNLDQRLCFPHRSVVSVESRRLLSGGDSTKLWCAMLVGSRGGDQPPQADKDP